MRALRIAIASGTLAWTACCGLADARGADPPPSADPPAAGVLDEGKFVVSSRGRRVRVEEFAFELFGDSLLVRAASYPAPVGSAPPAEGSAPVDKNMVVFYGGTDQALREYRSLQAFGADTLRRKLEFTGADTVYSSYRQWNAEGLGSAEVLPPGRLFVLDPPLFTPFAVIGRTLHGKVFDQRPIVMLVLGERDTVLEATVTDLGSETLRWGAKPVVARKLAIADARTRFTAWISPSGGLLRLTQPGAGLVVERLAPPVKRRVPPPRH